MKKFLLYSVVLLFVSCTKGDDYDGPLTLTELGIQFSAKYKIQQFIKTSTNPDVWNYVDMPGPVIVQFLNDSTATETRDTLPMVTRKFVLSGRTVIQKPKGVQYNINFLSSNTSCTNNCPVFINPSTGSIYSQFNEVFLQRPSANYSDGFRFIKQ